MLFVTGPARPARRWPHRWLPGQFVTGSRLHQGPVACALRRQRGPGRGRRTFRATRVRHRTHLLVRCRGACGRPCGVPGGARRRVSTRRQRPRRSAGTRLLPRPAQAGRQGHCGCRHGVRLQGAGPCWCHSGGRTRRGRGARGARQRPRHRERQETVCQQRRRSYGQQTRPWRMRPCWQRPGPHGERPGPVQQRSLPWRPTHQPRHTWPWRCWVRPWPWRWRTWPCQRSSRPWRCCSRACRQPAGRGVLQAVAHERGASPLLHAAGALSTLSKLQGRLFLWLERSCYAVTRHQIMQCNFCWPNTH